MTPKSVSFAAILLTSFLVCATPQVVQGAPDISQLTPDILFSDEKLLQVNIEVEEEDWEELASQTRSFGTALSDDRLEGEFNKPFTYFTGNASINGVPFKHVGIRKKGFIGSLDHERPSLKIKFNHTDKDGELHGITHLTLNNCKQDASLVNQVLTYKLFRKAGLPAPRCSYAHVTVNGKSLGIYAHVESMKKPMIRHSMGDDNGTLYEGTVVDFFEGWEKSFEHKFGNREKGLKSILAITEILEKSDLDSMESEIDQWLDIDAFIKFWVMESIIGLPDGYTQNQNNYYFFVDGDSGKLTFLPWGTDNSFSTRGIMNNYLPRQSVKTTGRITAKLYQIPSVRSKYQETLTSMLNDVWDEKELLADISRIHSLVLPHIHPNQKKYKEATEKMRSFITERKEDIMEEIADGMPEFSPRDKKPIIFATAGSIEGEFSAPYVPDTEEKEIDWASHGHANLTLTLEGKPIKVDQIGAYVLPGKPSRHDPKGDYLQLIIKLSRSDSNKGIRYGLYFPKYHLKQVEPGSPVTIQPHGDMNEWGGFFIGRKKLMLDASVTVHSSPSGDEKSRTIQGTISGKLRQMKNLF